MKVLFWNIPALAIALSASGGIVTAASQASARDSLALRHRQATAIPLTPALLATAFRDPRARDLLAGARATRLTQDSALVSYDATTYERLSVGLTLARFMRDRLLFRTERATHVRWSRASGAEIDVTGLRSGSQVLGADVDVEADDPSALIPYFPGREALWIGSGLAKANVSDRAIVNPLANGAEAYYRYATGDSLVLQLSPTHRVVVRELRVQPRASRWDVVVGSLWFDVSTGQLVRAVYRLARPMNVLVDGPAATGDPHAGMSPFERVLLPSVTAQVTVITVEYGLFEGRFWMPRTQMAEGNVAVGSIHLPIQIQQHVEYASVNGTLDLPPVHVAALDTATGASASAARDSAHAHECADPTAQRLRAYLLYNKTLPVAVRTPCDTVALTHSPTLPPSIYSSVDTLFHDDERMALVGNALALSREAAWGPQPPAIRYGVGYTRYNRIEGLSTAIDAQQIYGAGYTGEALLRFGVADRSVNGELSLTRSNGQQSYSVGAYRRLATANDWGDPFSLGASLTTLLFGRDDGVYYRTLGAEIKHSQTGGLFDSWRLFVERQFDAATETQGSLPHALSGHLFRDSADINATNGTVVGLALRRHAVFGEDPTRLRATSDVRLEGATGTFDYVRGMLEMTVDQPLTQAFRAGLTVSGGSSGGRLPTQRYWYLGGPYTIRGQPIASESGDAYWFARAELGTSNVGFKPFLFADLGWAGDRTHWTTGVQPMSGAGVGASMLDGMLHFDVARGVRPARGTQIDAYLDTRF